MKDREIKVTIKLHAANYESDRAVILEAIDALTYYACMLPEKQLQPWVKEIRIT